jgi:hypothetical protein
MKKQKHLYLVLVVLTSSLFFSCSAIHESINASADLSYAGNNNLYPHGHVGAPVAGTGGEFTLTQDLAKHPNNLSGPDSAMIANYADKNFVSLSEGINIMGKGWHEDEIPYETKNDFYYLELPLTVNYNTKFGNGKTLHVGLGPYVAWALFGHYSSQYTQVYNNVEDHGYYSFGGSNKFSAFDGGIRFTLGYSLSKKFDTYLSYDCGVSDIAINSPGTYDRINNRSFGINMAYRFK